LNKYLHTFLLILIELGSVKKDHAHASKDFKEVIVLDGIKLNQIVLVIVITMGILFNKILLI
jgi:hypothetical protein